MSGPSVAQETPGDIVLALLQVDPNLGCCEVAMRHAREDLTIRHTLASRLLRPEIRRHRVTVDYRPEAVRRIKEALRPLIAKATHSGLTEESFRVTRTGRADVFVDEVFIGRPLRTGQKLAFIRALKRRPLCVIESVTTFDEVLCGVPYPIMALCSPTFETIGSFEAMPALLQTPVERIPSACRPETLWSQEYRILMAADAA